MQATFYTFAKNPDSTSRPSGSGTSKTVRLKDSTSMLRPTFLMDRTAWDHSWNYAYIPDFGRYYFIGDTVYNGPNAEIPMEVDALASWKTQIGASTQYVVRSASAFNGAIPDNLYPVKEGETETVQTGAAYPTVANGTFVLGIISKEATAGSVAYYAMPYASITELSTKIMNYISDSGLFDNQWFTYNFQNMLLEPLKKIVSCNWFPYNYSDLSPTAQTTVMVGEWPIILSGGKTVKLLSDLVLQGGGTVARTFNLSQHPQAASRGSYMNLTPYTKYELIWNPFGKVAIDPTLISGATSLNCSMRWDWATGRGWLEAYSQYSGRTIQQVLYVPCQVGVEIQLSQQVVNQFQATGAMVHEAQSLVSGDVMGALSGVGSIVESMHPETSSVGQTGNFASYAPSNVPRFIQRFFSAADDDNTRRGRPLMEVRQISGLSGYMQCDHVDLDLPATQSETQTIKSKMEAGFYYE